MTDLDVKRWARMGAEVRLAELRQEMMTIFATFPELRQREGRQGRSAAPSSGRKGREQGSASSAAGGKKRRKMSAEARRKISAAQKARWAKQKGEEGAAKVKRKAR